MPVRRVIVIGWSSLAMVLGCGADPAAPAAAAIDAAVAGYQPQFGIATCLGTILDCQGRNVSNAAVTIGSISAVPTDIGGVTYYFSAGSISNPVDHATARTSNRDGKFIIFDVPIDLDRAYVQVWGYPAAGDVGGGLTLLAELPVPVEPALVAVGDYPPLHD